MKRYMPFVVSSVMLLASCTQAAVLSTDGKPNAVIVLGNDAVTAERTAAGELASYLKQVTGADFKTVNSAADAGDGVKIFVGQTGETKRALGAFDWKKLSADGIVIKCQGNNIVLAGDRPRGTLYSVYTFLEDHVGCRWWAPDAESVPNRPTLTIADTNYVYKPSFFWREAWYNTSCMESYAKFAAKLKFNGHYQHIPDELGGHRSIIGWCHTFDQILPAGKYFKAHPEWYSLRDGKRSDNITQLCLTNKEMRKAFIAATLAKVRENRAAGTISVSQNDNFNYCQCPKCTAAAEKLGGQSGLLLDFVNEVATAVQKEFPEFWVQTLAYQYTRHAPKNIAPRDNVIITLCSIECNFAKPLDSDENAAFRTDLEEWHKIAPRLFIWDYLTDFGNLSIPHPGYYATFHNIKVFRDYGAVAVFSQGDYWNRDLDFQAMRVWVLSKLHWNPDLDVDMLVDEFLNGYYKGAGPYMKQVVDLYVYAVNRENYYLRCGRPDDPFFKADDYIKAFGLLDKAYAAETDPAVKEHVYAQRKSLEFALYFGDSAIRKEVEAAGAVAKVSTDKWSHDYFDWATRTGNAYYREVIPLTFGNFVAAGLAKTLKSGNVPAECTGISDDDWIELQDSAAILWAVGDMVKPEDDALASDGKTLMMPGTHTQWAVQMSLSAASQAGMDECEVLVGIRGMARGTGEAFGFGLYDSKTGKEYAAKSVSVPGLHENEYTMYSLGVQKITRDTLLWVHPAKSEDVDAIYVDRVIVKRESTPSK